MGIKLLATDCDGVLTDGSVWFSESGRDIFKRYSFKDIMGLNLAQKLGGRIAVISGEKISKRLLQKLDIRKHYPSVKHPPILKQEIKDKAAALREVMRVCSVRAHETIYIGDDVNDISAIKLAGIGIAVSDAYEAVKQSAKMITRSAGGHGAVREIIDTLIIRKTKRVR